MCWHSKSEEQAKILWVEDSTKGWIPYNQSVLAAADYRIENSSKGYATMQKLFKFGWKIVNEKEMK